MAKRTYKSFRGKKVDMEELRRKHESTVAAGNMGVNAKGDKLGSGGEVVESAQSRARKHYKSTTTSKTTMSVKGDQSGKEEKVFQDEKEDATSVSKDQSAPKRTRKKSTPKKKEVIDEDGNITMEDVPEADEES